MKKHLTNNKIESYIESVSIPKDKYTNYYFVFMQELSDGKLSIVFTKGSPFRVWEFVYRKYYGGFSSNMLLSILLDFGENDILTYYADKKLKVEDEYTHENFVHLHLIRLAVLNKNTNYFYFRKSQVDDIVKLLSKVLNLSKSEIEDIVSTIMKNAKTTPTEMLLEPPKQRLKPTHKK